MSEGQPSDTGAGQQSQGSGGALPSNPANSEGQLLDQIMVAQASMWSAPLPPPDDLAKYNNAVSDGAERILAMAERRHAHALATEVRMAENAYRLARSGQILGAIIALAVLMVAGGIAWLGATTAAAIVISSTLIGAAGIFVVGRWRGQQQGIPFLRSPDDTD